MPNTPLNIIGFETGDLSERSSGVGVSSTVQSAIKRSGDYALRTNPGAANSANYRIASPAGSGAITSMGVTKVYVSFYFYYAVKAGSADEPIAATYNGSSTLRLELRLNSSGQLVIYDSTPALVATGTTVLAQNTWYRIDLQSNSGVSGNYELKINGVLELSGTANQTATSNYIVGLGKTNNRNSQAVDYYYDDVWIDETDYAPANYSIRRLDPVSDDVNGWNGTYADIDETPISETEYVSSTGGAAPMTATYNVETFASAGITAGSTIHLAKAFSWVAEPSAITNTYTYGIVSGATTSVTNNYNAGATSAEISKLYVTDPNTAASWAQAGLEAIKLRVNEGTASVSSMRVYAAYMMVVYTAPTVSRRIFHIS